MQFTFPIVSSVNPGIPVTLISVDADSVRRGKRQAKHIARTRQGISDPIVVDEHTAALWLRQAALEAHRPQMTGLNGRREPWWTKPTRIADCYDER